MDTNDLKAWRQAHDLTLAELAELLGVRLNSVYRWERGMHAPPGRLLCLALERLDQELAERSGGRDVAASGRLAQTEVPTRAESVYRTEHIPKASELS